MEDREIEALEAAERVAEENYRKARDARRKAEEQARALRTDALKPLVVRAHDVLCCYNHTDGCGWGYESPSGAHNWLAFSHARWLSHYERLFSEAIFHGPPPTISSVSKLLDGIEEIRKIHPQALWLLRHGLEPR